MKQLDELNFLIDAASLIAGSDNKLSALCGTTRMKISDWRKGRAPCPPEFQALMADIAGFNAQEMAIRALVSRHEGTPMGEKLMRVLGKPSLAIGAAIGSAGASAAEILGIHDHAAGIIAWITQCILC
jgi:DNA-binding transcriptional regulator YdaS (Cro superfamily)